MAAQLVIMESATTVVGSFTRHRRRLLMASASYSILVAPWLWAPLR